MGLFAGLKTRGKMIAVNGTFIAENYCPFNAVFQLPHIAGPVIFHEHINGRSGKTFNLFEMFSGIFFQKKIGQQDHIGFSHAQARHVNGKNIEPKIEILPEFFLFQHLLKVAVGGGNNSDIHLYCLVPSHPFKLFLLKYSEKFNLGTNIHGTDLIKENGAGMGKLKFTFLLMKRTGKCPFFMAEQLTLNEIFRQCRTVNLYKRVVVSKAVIMYGVGNQLFACSALSSYQNRCIASRNLGNHLKHFPHFIAVSNDIGKAVAIFKLPFEADILLSELLLFHVDTLKIDDMAGDHGGDHRQGFFSFFQDGFSFIWPVCTQCPYYPASFFDRNTDK